MSTVGDILKSVRDVLLLQAQVERLEQQIDGQGDEMKLVARDIIALDKRLIRTETMMEMTTRGSTRPPALEGH